MRVAVRRIAMAVTMRRIAVRRPRRQESLFQLPLVTRGQERLRITVPLDPLEERVPQPAIDRAIPPVAVNGRPRTMAFAEREVRAPLTAAVGLRRVRERDVALKPLFTG